MGHVVAVKYLTHHVPIPINLLEGHLSRKVLVETNPRLLAAEHCARALLPSEHARFRVVVDQRSNSGWIQFVAHLSVLSPPVFNWGHACVDRREFAPRGAVENQAAIGTGSDQRTSWRAPYSAMHSIRSANCRLLRCEDLKPRQTKPGPSRCGTNSALWPQASMKTPFH